jgi:hypothetical protein
MRRLHSRVVLSSLYGIRMSVIGHRTLHPSWFGPLFNNLIIFNMILIEKRFRYLRDWMVGRGGTIVEDRSHVGINCALFAVAR